jgi:hypothetical protein
LWIFGEDSRFYNRCKKHIEIKPAKNYRRYLEIAVIIQFIIGQPAAVAKAAFAAVNLPHLIAAARVCILGGAVFVFLD